MLDAYRGGVDDDGESIDDARREIARVHAGEYGQFQPEASFLAISDATLVSASLVTFWQSRPLLSFLMTRASHKQRGLGRYLLQRSMDELARRGHDTLDLFVTATNQPAVALYQKMGFAVIPAEPR